ncbi:hypothetical protein [Dictyobacter formicarum]|uniref:Uncharacterized protein n=1 Tax=Dictyobacter formicarum TaxID=2778368 RepID=A0ABQ3VSE0_9CHLR|nr:hypothetical protein [Dictyobacter formicarum]GHO88036.1 hypothetical protein KSZ_60420 [Dictyobacter formicarum]
MNNAQPTFQKRVGFHWICVAPATILSDEICSDEEHSVSLREETSSNGLCFLSIFRHLPHADMYEAYVAATAEDLRSCPLTIFVTEEQLYYALPYDCRMEQKSAAQIQAILFAHAEKVKPAILTTPSENVQIEEQVMLEPLPEPISVSSQAIEKAIEEVCPMAAPKIWAPTIQQSLLCLALHTLQHEMQHNFKHIELSLLEAWHALIKQTRKWHYAHQQQVVHVVREFDRRNKQPVWNLYIGIPEQLTAVA